MTASEMVKRGYIPHTHVSVSRGGTEVVDGGVIEESYFTVNVNGYTIASMMCSPIDREPLALGFLYNEGIIETYSDISEIIFGEDVINVVLHRQNVTMRRQMILTSGCGGGVTFQQLNSLRSGVETDFVTTPEVVFDRMHDLRSEAVLYSQVRGVHSALLGSAEAVIYSAEDVGRHNTIDKIAGKMLREDFDARNCMIVTSGRISSEMLGKANRMNVPIVVSRTAPTSTAVQLAEQWNICVVGYVRQDSMRIYTHPFRLQVNVE